MDLMLLIIFGALTLIGAAFSNLLSDEFKAWQPWIVRKIVSLAVSAMPATERDRWHEEWTGYCAEVPGLFGQVFAALGLVLSAWKVNRHVWNYRFFKRVVDLGFATISVAVLMPLWMLISMVIALFGKRPIFYGLRRVGKGGREIVILKFTTFTKEGQPDGIGRFLRRTSLDEIPQLFNILKGDMSVVGPRAKRFAETDGDTDTPDADVRPGLLPPPEGDDATPSIWKEIRHIAYAFVATFLPDRHDDDKRS